MDRLFSKLHIGTIKVGERSSFPAEGTDAPAEDELAELPSLRTTDDERAAVSEEQAEVERTQEPASQVGSAVGSRHRPGYGGELPTARGEVLKVSSRSRPSAVAGAIAGVVRESGRAEVQAIGAGAVNQAVKAVAIARDYLRETEIDAVCLPSLIDLTIDDADRTAVRLVVEPR